LDEKGIKKRKKGTNVKRIGQDYEGQPAIFCRKKQRTGAND